MDHVEKIHHGNNEKILGKGVWTWYLATVKFQINEEMGKLEIDCNGVDVVLFEAHTIVALEDLKIA